MLSLHAGDLVLLPTDGVTDALSAAGEAFGIDRMLDVVRTHRQQPARQIVDTLYQAVRAHCHPGQPHDDITALILKVGPEPD
jgi:sigma-B regulation protein RsbU (phosphoserine phosphatase)